MNQNIPTKKNNKRKRLIIISSVIVGLLIIFPFALNFYLQRKLPDLINEKTPYQLTLKNFNLSLISGDFSATDLKISTKNPKDSKVTQIDGTIKKIQITDFGVWKAIFNKSYHADQFLLSDSNVKVRLAKKSEKEKKQSKKNDIHINNIVFSNVFADISNADGKPVFKGKNININLKDIEQNDDASKIPLAFKEFKIDATDVQIGVNEFYQIDAEKISAANKTLELMKFHLKPLQNANQYNAKNIFDFASDRILAKDFNISKDSLIVSDITFTKPDLKVTSTGKNTVDKDKNPKEVEMKIGLKNIDFQQGKIAVMQANKEKTASIDQFNFKLTDIVFDKNTVKEKIPFRFTNHDIEAENIYFKANNNQALKIKKISSRNSNIVINQFEMIALGKNTQKDLFDIKTEEIKLINNRTKYVGQKLNIDFDGLEVKTPQIKMISASKKQKKGKSETPEFDAKIGFITISNGKVEQIANGKVATASVDNFNFKMTNIICDENTLKEKIPFRFSSQDVDADNIYFKANNNQALKIKKISSDKSNILIKQFQMIALGRNAQKDLFDIKTNEIKITNNRTKYIGKKLNIDFDGLELKTPQIKVISATRKSKLKKGKSETLDFNAKIGVITISNGKISQTLSGKEKLAVGKFNVQVKNISSNNEQLKKDVPIYYSSHAIAAQNIFLDAGKYYTLKIANLKNSGKQTDIIDIKYLPKYSRAGFSKVIAKESDLYSITVNKIGITDNNSRLFKNQQIDINKVNIDGLKCNIYHDLAPPDDTEARNLFSKKLRDVKMPMFVKSVSIKNSKLEYEEDAERSNIPGKLTFEKFGIEVANVNNGKIAGRPTTITADAKFSFYGDADTEVNWKFDVMNLEDKYTINGKILKLSADNVNLFVRPYLNVTLDGNIDYLKFDYYGTNAGIAGNFYFKYNDLYVNILNKKGNERKLLSKVANWFVKNESTGEPDHVVIEKKREADRSFFSLLWQGIMEGLKKYLI